MQPLDEDPDAENQKRQETNISITLERLCVPSIFENHCTIENTFDLATCILLSLC